MFNQIIVQTSNQTGMYLNVSSLRCETALAVILMHRAAASESPYCESSLTAPTPLLRLLVCICD
jgi:hypothetical protein